MNIGKTYASGNSTVMKIEAPFTGVMHFLIQDNTDKQHEKEPDFRVLTRSCGKMTVCGGLWYAMSDNGTRYKQGQIESPIFDNGSMRVALFHVKEPETITDTKGNEQNVLENVVWSPPKPKKKADIPENTYNGAQNINNILTL